jgi:hypothetical protein
VHVSRERVGQLGHQGMGVVLLPRRGCKPSVKVIGMESVEKRRARTLGNWIWHAERRALRTAVLMRSRLGSCPFSPSVGGQINEQ